jgi:starch-binding outer membrane protein, SusD/RagB family
MKPYLRKALALALITFGAGLTGACDSFLEVDNPNSLETDAIDPARDAKLLSQSVYQQFVSGIGDIPVYMAWFTNHARVGDTFPTRNDFGRRDIAETNTHISSFWSTIHRSLQFARTTIRSTEGAGPTVDLARSHWVAGFAILMEAEVFCEGTIAENTLVSRRKMSTVELLDSAIVEFKKVQTIAASVTGTTATEAGNLSTSAQVGIARALLQAGRKAEASAAAALVPAAFNYNLTFIDNSTQRSLGNTVWSWSESRISLVTGPEFRAMADAGDTRIAYVDAKRLAQDGVLQFYRQNKFTGWGSPIRFASGLEARYIKVEADADPVAMLTFINERRTVGKQTLMAATTDMNALMSELMLQKSKDFWLEGKDMADFRRNPTTYPFVLPPGDNYYKPASGPVRDQTCWPVPKSEIDNNAHWNDA